MTYPCKDCANRREANCANMRTCDKYAEWFNAVWAEIQAKFAEIAKRQ